MRAATSMPPFVLSLSKDFAVPFAHSLPFVLSSPVLSQVEGSKDFVVPFVLSLSKDFAVPFAPTHPFGLSLSKAFVLLAR